MGLSHQRRGWTREEDSYLLEHVGSVSVRAMARNLGRSRTAVNQRCSQLQASWERTGGYSVQALAALFGVSCQKMKRWIERGLFGKVYAQGGADDKRVTKDDVGRFIRHHHREYDLTRVDQAWFIGMIFGGSRKTEGVR